MSHPGCRGRSQLESRQVLLTFVNHVTLTKTKILLVCVCMCEPLLGWTQFELLEVLGEALEKRPAVLRMNTALKHWKEAATIILAAGTSHRAGLDILSPRSLQKGAGGGGQPALPHRSAFDYEVLLLKRSSKSGFMPNAYVFPGGLVDSSDFSSEWLDVFKAFRDSPNFGLGKVKQPAETRPPIFATDRVPLGSPVPGEVALRICALRETFEESGVLLAVSKMEESSLLKSIADETHPQVPKLDKLCDQGELTKWRSLVNKSPSNFIRMCRELDLLPNIWALHEWGNWLTPTGVYGKERRYDTAFFICCLQAIPHTLQDEKEIVHFKVISLCWRKYVNIYRFLAVADLSQCRASWHHHSCQCLKFMSYCVGWMGTRGVRPGRKVNIY